MMSHILQTEIHFNNQVRLHTKQTTNYAKEKSVDSLVEKFQ